MTSMSAITSGVTSIAGAFAGTVGEWVSVITDNPLILFFVLVPFVGIGVGFLKRLIRL